MTTRKHSADPVSPEDFSSLMAAAELGDTSAAGAIFAVLYSELHHLAVRELSRQRGPNSVSATTLLHEAYLNVAERGPSFPDRARFMGYAARVMRRLIIDYARSRRTQKRGGQFHITSLDTETESSAIDERELTRIADAVDELAEIDPPLAEVVELRFFGGFSFAEIARMRCVSERTVQRTWEKARIYLHHSLRADLPP